MLAVGRDNVERAGLHDRIRLERCDAKRLPHTTGAFGAVISNSIVHHIPEPAEVLAEMARVTAPGGVLFVRDLLRPDDETTLRTPGGTVRRRGQPPSAEDVRRIAARRFVAFGDP